MINPVTWLASLLPNVPLLAGPKRNLVSFKAERVRVPVGHRFPLGNVATQPFEVTIEYGARWHPDWEAPRICVMAFRFLPHGDAMGFSGGRATAFPLPKGVATLAQWHGITIGKDTPFVLALLDELGLALPQKRETIAAFMARPAQLMATVH